MENAKEGTENDVIFLINQKKNMQETNKVTNKTQEQLMAANWDDLNLEEKALRSDMERHPSMTWEVALALSEMSPL